MPRGRSAPRSASSGRSSGFGSRSSTPPPRPHHHTAPPPVHAPHVPAPVPQSGLGGMGGGMGGGLMGMMATGAAMGTGSAIAHRAVDGMMGGRGGEQAQAAGAPAEAYPQQQQQQYQQQQQPAQSACDNQMRAFTDCMSRTQGDMASCNLYFDAMQSCKTKIGGYGSQAGMQ